MRSPAGIDAYTPFGAAARSTISALADQMIANLPGARSGEDIEAVHDMRVASRRMRAALRVFAACFLRRCLRSVTSDVRGVTQALGAVRDQDVLIDYLEKWPEAQAIAEQENAVRDIAREQMLAALDRFEQDGAPQRLQRLLSKATMTASKTRRARFYRRALGLVTPRLAELIAISPCIDDPSRVDELHQMRIAAKRLRYTMEVFVPCYGLPLTNLISDVKLLQEQLGEIHDCDVWTTRIQAYASVPHTALAAPALIDDLRRTRDRAYNDALIHWRSMAEGGFADALCALLSTRPSAALPDNNGGTKVELDTDIQEQPVEAQETPEPAPAAPKRRRTRRKPIVAAEPVAEPIAEPAEPMAIPEMTSADIPDISSEIASAMASELLQEESEDSSVPIEVEEVITTTEPQHPGILQLQSLVRSSAMDLAEAEALSPKLAKQFAKLDTVLEALPAGLRTAGLKKAIRAEKLMSKIRASLDAISVDGKPSGKKLEKSREEIRDLRKRLSGFVKPNGKRS